MAFLKRKIDYGRDTRGMSHQDLAEIAPWWAGALTGHAT